MMHFEKIEVWHNKPPIEGFSNTVGNYYCTCKDCGSNYSGDKHSFQCYPCAVKSYENRIDNNKGAGI